MLELFGRWSARLAEFEASGQLTMETLNDRDVLVEAAAGMLD
jgi:hypothetical protein